MKFDDTYIDALKSILDKGIRKENRTGTDTISLFNTIVKAEEDNEGFYNIPLSNLRKIYFRGALIELFWILGLHMNDSKYSSLPMTNTKYLKDMGVNYWDPWADTNGNLGPVYGAQLVRWNNIKQNSFINQIESIIKKLRTNPNDRRLVASMWNPAELEDMALPPCHYCMEFYSEPGETKRKLHTRWIQRSADMPIGIPYDMILYSMLNKLIALCTNHIPGHVYGLLGDSHIYVNQLDGVDELIKNYNSEEYKQCPQPKLLISDRIFDIIAEKGHCDLSDFNIDGSDFELVEYKPCKKINIPVSI